MANDIHAFIDKIVNDAEKKIRADLEVISSKVQDDFIKKAREAVLLYYAQYDPIMYERTYNLQNNVINENITFDVLNNGEYGAYIRFSADEMYDYYDGGDKFMVVESFMEGKHGRKRRSPSPGDFMQEFQDGYKTKTLDGYFRSFGYRVNK